MTRLRRSLGAGAVGLLLLTGCSSLEGTGDKGYISGDQRVRVVDPADRGSAVELTGTSLTGDPVDVADSRGRVLVVNTWWSGCAPCRSEMPMLTAAAKELGERADFLGINIRDASASQGQAFIRSVGAEYPSIYDPTGKAVLAFAGKTTLSAIPTTIVLDAEGRVAAVITGEIPSKQTLVDVVDEVAANAAAESGGETADG
ncbi:MULTISPECIES: TlpA disulfide reductase family protein [unclassified Nocardioides]|uniref:TlpA family protein disulfide reductase n=1 Tax=unclassified Nocardioides TaxID=2615069 RepID=UPI0000571251|nr:MULTISPECIES: TlpA disulfide reductase family protein [unclassified Nocardioides]ABL80043.1 Redoxin domain protein [Nocardioides sp. JS614]